MTATAFDPEAKEADDYDTANTHLKFKVHMYIMVGALISTTLTFMCCIPRITQVDSRVCTSSLRCVLALSVTSSFSALYYMRTRVTSECCSDLNLKVLMCRLRSRCCAHGARDTIHK